jgi:aspartyl-tRNA(Asn)/glutamyl-tRNA(Gln) amidotransferase subunit A
VGLGAACPLHRALRRHRAGRVGVPLARLTAIDGVWITELSPADGRRLAVKDLFDTEGVRTTYGSAVFAEHVPAATAEAVRRLEAAGWVNAGKANLHEFAYGTTSQNLHYGVVPNPSFPGRTSGGSSGGSAAALALELVEGALGTDTGGSIRIPAACCGIVGFKPTFGLVPIEGVFPLAPSFDHAGPMARSVDGCIEQMRALVPGFDVAAVGDARVAVTWSDRCEPLVRERVLAAAAVLGAEPIEFPTAEDVAPAFMREIADVHRELYAENAELYGENIRGKVERCLAISDGEYEAAVAARAALVEHAEAALDGYDLLLTPTLAFVPPPADVVETEIRADLTRFTFPFNALGWPALAVPAGLAEEGLPASVQLVGRSGDDALVLGTGLAL